jgi:DNA-binding beta-propeller fold protein YncE
VVTGKKDNTFRGPVFGSTESTHENTVRAMMATIDIDSESLVSEAYYDFDNSDAPTGVRFSPYGDIIIIALQGNNELFAIDALDIGAARTTTRIPLQQTTTAADGRGGRAPQGLAISQATKRILSQNFMSRSTTVFDASQLLDRGAYQLARLGETTKVAVDGLSAEVRLGKEIFYNANDPRMGAETYMSCASCHNDGSHDGRAWDFTGSGEGLRRTTDLRGRGGMRQGNVHWSGNFDEI